MEKMKLPSSIWTLDEMIFNFTVKGGSKAKEQIDKVLYGEEMDKGELHEDFAKYEAKAKKAAIDEVHESIVSTILGDDAR